MNILLIQENGRHDANRAYRECFSLQRGFNALMHRCDVWGLGHSNFVITPDFESYDVIINLENYDENKWVPSLNEVNSPTKMLWSIDAHCRGEEPYETIFADGNYDVLLHSTKDFVKKDYHVWFPNAFDDTLIRKTNSVKKNDVGFCGSWGPDRRRLILEKLRDVHGASLDIFVIGDEMVRAINSYRCHFNLNIGNDINYRSFETIGCGTLLLTNYNPQYELLGFEDGMNCLMYNSEEELEFKITQIKENSIDIDGISSSGYELSKKHTYLERCKTLLNILI